MNEQDTIEIRKKVRESVADLFNTMFSMELKDAELDILPESQWMAGSVIFSGEVTGFFCIQLEDSFAGALAAEMLGKEEKNPGGGEEGRDLVAEMSKIIGGNLTSEFCDAGFTCMSSPPSITRGIDFITEPLLSPEIYERLTFKCQNHFVIVEIGVSKRKDPENQMYEKISKTEERLQNINAESVVSIDIRENVREALIDVYKVMLSMEIEESEELERTQAEGAKTVGSVSFTGDVSGGMSIQVTEKFARQMAASMLDREESEIEGGEEVKDLIGEISSIVGGSLRSLFTDMGLFCVLSSPSITSGGDFRIEPLSWTRHERFAFRYEKEIIFLEAGVRIPEILVSQDNLRGIMNNLEKEKKPGSGDGVQADDPENLTIKDDEKSIEIPAKTESAEEKEVKLSEPLPAVTTPLVQNHQFSPEATPIHADDPTVERVDAENTEISRDKVDFILDIPIVLTAVLGRTKKKIDEVLRLGEGSVVELSKLDGEPVDILANKTLVARGEVIVDKEKYGIRIIEIIEKMKRIESLR